MLSCEEITRLISWSLDKLLPLRQRLQVRMHLLLCGACSRFRKQVLFLREAARRAALDGPDVETAPGSGLSPAARERIKRALKSELL